MTKENFSVWKLPYLQEVLVSRGIIDLGLQETETNFLQEQNKVMKNQLDKLVIGRVNLLDLYSLVNG